MRCVVCESSPQHPPLSQAGSLSLSLPATALDFSSPRAGTIHAITRTAVIKRRIMGSVLPVLLGCEIKNRNGFVITRPGRRLKERSDPGNGGCCDCPHPRIGTAPPAIRGTAGRSGVNGSSPLDRYDATG